MFSKPFSEPNFLITLMCEIILYKFCYKETICSLEIKSTFSLSGWVLSSWRTSNFKVPDSFNQAATTEPVDTYLPILHLATRNGAPMLARSALIARLRAPSPTTLLCFPHPVRMLARWLKCKKFARKERVLLRTNERIREQNKKDYTNKGKPDLERGIETKPGPKPPLKDFPNH